MNKLKLLLDILFQGTFWCWNLVFIVVVYVGILPFIGIPLIAAAFDGDVPWDFCLTFFTLTIVPVACTFMGAKYLRTEPKKLIRFFYGVEAPLFAWCLIRLFLIRELTTASTLVLGTLFVCIVAFAIELFEGYQKNIQLSSWLQMVTHTLMLLMGIYWGIVLLFYAIPVAIFIIAGIISFIANFFSFQWLESFQYWLRDSVWILLSIILFGFTCTLFVVMPFAVTGLYIHSGQKVLRSFAQQYGQKIAVTGSVAIISIWLITLFNFNQQPQVKAFNLLAKVPENRPALLAASSDIRKGLVNANLYPYRYLSTIENNNHIYDMYRGFKLPKSFCSFLQNSYNNLLSPFLYNGSRNDVEKSAQLYANFFDTPLQKAERKSVRHAIQSTAIVDQAKAGLLNINQKKVWLEKQDVTVNPHGDWADIEIHEVYNNQTNDVEEILYYFSLPESATITGLWLGESDNLNERFRFQVSPRGAAQEVYNSQVRRTRPVDPALLEQVGAGQYRLRAFPVPPRLSSSDLRNGRKQIKMHLWLTYQVMQQDGGWALPKLAEKRNIFWTKFTQRIRNGERHWLFADSWFEDFVPNKQNKKKKARQIDLNGYTVSVKPLTSQDYVFPKNKKYALILDTSYSMASHAQEVTDTFDWWQQNLSNNDIDLYITDFSPTRAQLWDDLSNFELSKITYYGSIQIKDLLQQFAELKNNSNYDAVLVITDEGSYELENDKQDIPEINSPLWMVHLGGNLPRAYDDKTLQAIQNSNGGTVNNIPTVMQRLGTEAANNYSVVNGYSWQVQPSNIETVSHSKLSPIAARQLVYSLSKQQKDGLSLAELDNVHQIAKKYDIITPYSSMIVLVNDEQREMLKQAEMKTDRFDREIETGVEQLDKPFNPFEVSAVPEPDLWLLLTIATLALMVISQRQKILNLEFFHPTITQDKN